MSFADERLSIEKRFADQWTALNHTCLDTARTTPSIAYENVDFSIPEKTLTVLPVDTPVTISDTTNYDGEFLVTKSQAGWFETTQPWGGDDTGSFIIFKGEASESQAIAITKILEGDDDKARFYYDLGTAWVRLIIQNGNSGYRGINNLQRHAGVILVQIFVSKKDGFNEKGTVRGRCFADEVVSIFNNTKFDDIVTDVSSIITIDSDEAWHQTNVSTSFYRDD